MSFAALEDNVLRLISRIKIVAEELDIEENEVVCAHQLYRRLKYDSKNWDFWDDSKRVYFLLIELGDLLDTFCEFGQFYNVNELCNEIKTHARFLTNCSDDYGQIHDAVEIFMDLFSSIAVAESISWSTTLSGDHIYIPSRNRSSRNI